MGAERRVLVLPGPPEPTAQTRADASESPPPGHRLPGPGARRSRSGVAAASPQARPLATRARPLADARPSPRTDRPPAPLPDSGPHPLPSRPCLPSRLPQERGCRRAAAPVSAGQAHPGTGGAGSSSGSKSRTPRSSPVTWKLWARAPHVASQEEASTGRRVDRPFSVRVSIRPPPGQASPGTSLPALEFPPGQRGGKEAVQLPARPPSNPGATVSRSLGERTSYRTDACA